ncbi:MAG: DoxX family protein [Myxococcaceae bacterium]|nr:DoxX family protein [Myxococcaceae bacterium]MCI0671720.1 DoxX family protein [Myxococcaceae bacterium]
MSRTSIRTAVYWAATSLVSLGMTFGGIADLARFEPNMNVIAALGYPTYFATFIGVWKLLGVLAILAPRLPRLKEWAYAGFAFNFAGAIVSHLAVGDPVHKAIAPAALLGIAFASWALRPQSRRLGTVMGDSVVTTRIEGYAAVAAS